MGMHSKRERCRALQTLWGRREALCSLDLSWVFVKFFRHNGSPILLHSVLPRQRQWLLFFSPAIPLLDDLAAKLPVKHAQCSHNTVEVFCLRGYFPNVPLDNALGYRLPQTSGWPQLSAVGTCLRAHGVCVCVCAQECVCVCKCL